MFDRFVALIAISMFISQAAFSALANPAGPITASAKNCPYGYIWDEKRRKCVRDRRGSFNSPIGEIDALSGSRP